MGNGFSADKCMLYNLAFSEIAAEGTVVENQWIKIIKKAETGTALPVVLLPNDIYYQNGLITLVLGDEVKVITVNKVCLANSISVDPTREESEVTTWCDNDKVYEQSRIVDTSVTIGGFTDQQGDLMAEITSNFLDVVEDSGGGPQQRRAAQARVFHFMFGMNERPNGATSKAMYKYLPVIISTVSESADGSSPVGLNLGCKVQGSESPRQYNIVGGVGEAQLAIMQGDV